MNKKLLLFHFAVNIPSQQKVLKRLLKILQHFEDCTKFLNSHNAITSAIILNMKVICHFFEKGEKGLFLRLGSTVAVCKSLIKKRFDSHFNDKNLVFATYLDPQFKTTFLEDKFNGQKFEKFFITSMIQDTIASQISSPRQDSES